MVTPSCYRCFQFSLATLLVGVTVVAGILAYYVNWRQGRERLLAELDATEFPSLSYSSINKRPAPGLMPLLGERGVNDFSFYLCYGEGALDHVPTAVELSQMKPAPRDADLIRRVQSLFPEASVEVSGFVIVSTPDTYRQIDVPKP